MLTATTTHHLELFAVLTALSVSYSVLVRHVERLRRGLTEGHVANSLDVWVMAGTLLLPPSWLTALVLLVYVAEWPSRKIVGGGRPRRYVLSVGIILLAALAGVEVHGLWPGKVGVLGVILAWSAVNDVLIAGAMLVGGSRTGIRRLLSLRNHAFDLATKLIGVFLAMLLSWHPVLAAGVIPLLLLGHRIALHDSIRETFAFDPQTGLWSEDGWRLRAEQVVAQAPAAVVLMLIDPTLPQQEGTIHRTLVSLFFPSSESGDKEMARAIRYVIGRYGTRQVALLCEVDVVGAGVLLGKHVRDRLRHAGVACVVGASVGHCVEFDDLLMRAGEDLMGRRAQSGVSMRW